MRKKLTYKNSGVDIDVANSVIKKLKPHINKTKRKGVLGTIGGFGGFYQIEKKDYKTPVLVSSTDGVGTKLLIAHKMKKYNTIGIDLVAMCVNDILTCGAEPLFFLDYLAIGKLKPMVFNAVLKGIIKGCQDAGCALLGGETAEMPGVYGKDDYDLAGFSVGVVDKNKIIDGKRIKSGDVLVGVASSGLHSNGYSLARRVFSDKEIKTGRWGTALIKPTKIYVKPLLSLMRYIPVKGLVHITGGGFYDNIPRILPNKTAVAIEKKSWPVPLIFKEIQSRGSVSDREMYTTFNMGIGMVIVASENNSSRIVKFLRKKGMASWVIGSVEKGNNNVIIA